MVSGTVLVVDEENPLGRGMVRELRLAGWRVAATFRKAERSDPAEDGSDILRTPWGKASPVSARNVMLRTLTAFERIDAVVFTFSPSLKRILLHEADYAEIEAAVDEWIRGTLFLLREALAQLVRQGSGVLALVEGHSREGSAVSPPLEAMVRGGIAELSASLLGSYGGEGVSILRFETSSPKTDQYVRFVAETLAASRGRPPRARSFRFRAAPRLLGRLPFRGRPAD